MFLCCFLADSAKELVLGFLSREGESWLMFKMFFMDLVVWDNG